MRSSASAAFRLVLVPLAAAVALTAIGLLSPSDTRLALLNSARLAAGATAIALPLGSLLAILIARFDLPGRRLAAAALGVLLFLPLYVQLSGWEAAAGRIGWWTVNFGSMEQPLVAGMRGAIIVHGLAAVPWVALIVGLGLAQIDRAQEEAALLVLPPAGVLARVTLPQCLPFFVAAAIWTAIGTTSEMTVTNIFLMNATREKFERTYTEQFYSKFSLTGDAGQATLAVLPGVLSLIVLVLASLWIAAAFSRRRKLIPAGGSLVFPAGMWRPAAAALLWLIVTLLVAVPIAALINKAGFVVLHEGELRTRSWSLLAAMHEVAAAPRRFAVDFSWTLRVAAAAATAALICGTALAWLARGSGWRTWPALAAVVLGVAIPGPLVGVALIQLLNHDLPPRLAWSGGSKSWLLILYDHTPLAPILAQSIRALPLATLIAWHSFRTLADDVLAAAALGGCSPPLTLWRIALPQRRRALCAAWLAAFAVAAGDLAWVHLVTPPGMDLIQRRVFGLVHSGVEEQVAAIGLVNIAAYSLLAIAILWLLRPRYNPRMFRSALPAVLIALVAAAPAAALDYVTIKRDGAQRDLTGRIEVEAADGTLLFQGPDGQQWMLTKNEILSRKNDEKPFTPLTPDEMAQQLKTELPGFKMHKTKNYVIAYNTSDAYAQWVGKLFERLNGGFYTFWKTAGAELHEPKFPLVALLFRDQASYELHTRRELGGALGSIYGYYSLTTNRMTTYDLTGVEGVGVGGDERAAARIQQILSQPQAERTVATLIHEATHQISFNSGFQVRFTEMPFWLSEGLAIYFETPDLSNKEGWKGIRVNRVNLQHFQKSAQTRPTLTQLITEDKRFREARTSADAYAEAWAFTYFLIKTRREAYVKYLRLLADRPLAVYLEPEERLKEFQQCFGNDLPKLETAFLQFMRGVR